MKQLEAIFRYTELVLFEVKHDQMRRSERNFINWAEEQRSILFAKNPIKVFSFLNIIQFQNLYSTIINNVGSFLNVEKWVVGKYWGIGGDQWESWEGKHKVTFFTIVQFIGLGASTPLDTQTRPTNYSAPE